MNLRILLFILLSLPVCAQPSRHEKPLRHNSCREVSVYIFGIGSAEDQVRLENLLKNNVMVTQFKIKDFPQQYSRICLHPNLSALQLNDYLKTGGFYILNKDFNDEKEIEFLLNPKNRTGL